MVRRAGLRIARLRAGGSEGGFALLLALFVTLFASAAMMLSAAALKVELDETRAEAIRIRLDAMVDAAIAESLADRDLSGLTRRPFGDGWIESRVERLAGGRARIQATAMLGTRVRDAEVEVVVVANGRPRVLEWRATPSS
ncbi:MAG TPA: hypothetical protein VNB06_21915 [Thermoanaerobaculia bacterium]|nr:hypothetical protein [Thermoanaerobaculia bacterium]